MRYRTVLLILIMTFSLGWALSTTAVEDTETVLLRHQIRELREQISLGNLLNGLYLTAGQEQNVLELAKKANAARAAYQRQATALASEMKTAFAHLRQEIYQGNGIKPATARGANQSNHREKELREQMQKKLVALERELGTVLTNAQKEVIRDFAPCLLPPRNIGQPVRAGQAHDYGHALTKLTNLRKMPAARYHARRGFIAQRQLDELEQRFRLSLTEEQRRENYIKLVTAMDKARSMSAVDFQLEKQKLAEEYGKIIDDLKGYHKPPANLYGQQGRLGKLGRFLLSPQAVEVLEQRAALAGNYKGKEMSRLASMEKADNCQDAICVLKKAK